jgi:2,4-dienoyl-CoA reductase-like NADH-dependent reductase (Old Yellow Enzyme family)/thioredoxin reductase
MYIDIVGKEHPKQVGISDDGHIEGLKRLAAAIHEGETLAIAHINHAGRAARPKVSGSQPIAPSEVSCPLTGVTPAAMTTDQIADVIAKYAQAARRAVDAGFDIVELQFGLGYLVAQFISPHTNLRDDDYGGSKEKRYRFASEVLAAVREQIGDDFPLMARISATEKVQGGLKLEDAIFLAKFLQEHNVAAVHVVSGSICDSPPWYFQHMRLPQGKNLEWASTIKETVDIPVIVAGRLGDPNDIRRAIDGNMVDGIALGRPLVADPDLPLKMIENRDEEVLQCGACLQGCFMKVKSGEGLACNVNPEVGRESERFSEAEESKTVVVVGGGPGGMQAALTASRRGHKVILVDRDQLGGQFNLSHLPPGKNMLKRPLDAFVRMVEKSDIDIRLSKEITSKEISAEHPDIVILATGSTPIIPSIPGLDDPLTGRDVLTRSREIGKRVLIIGGGMVGLESAEFLAKRDHKITVVELLDDVGRDMVPIAKKLTMMSLAGSGVEILTETEVTRFEDGLAYVKSDGTERSLGEFDSVVVAIGMRSVSDLESSIREEGIEVVVIGDAKAPRKIFDAVKEGYDVVISSLP